MRKRNLAFIDLEATGLDPEKHEIIELGLVLAEQTVMPDGMLKLAPLLEWSAKVKPEHIENADPESLAICHYSEAAWKDALDLQSALSELAQKTVGAMMVGHNVAHDFAYLNKAFSMTGVENTMHYHKLDTVSIAYAKLFHRDEVEKLTLHHLSEHFNIENTEPHAALADARATFEVFQKLMAL